MYTNHIIFNFTYPPPQMETRIRFKCNLKNLSTGRSIFLIVTPLIIRNTHTVWLFYVIMHLTRIVSHLVRCSPLHLIENADVHGPYTSDIGSTVDVLCHKGHRFKDGQRVKQLSCLTSGQWDDPGKCIGKGFPRNVTLYVCKYANCPNNDWVIEYQAP